MNRLTLTNADYERVATFQDLVDINISFLRGLRKQTYYHATPLDEETLPLVDKLVDINEHGFYSTGGQPGLLEYNQNGPLGIYSMEQKSFLEGYCENNLVTQALLEYLDTGRENYYFMVYSQKQGVPIRGNMPATYRTSYNVTRDKLIRKHNDWRYYTNLPLRNCYFDESGYEQVDDIIGKCLFIQIAAKEYGPEYSVEDFLLNFFRRSLLDWK
jgi:hypothetical protein